METLISMKLRIEVREYFVGTTLSIISDSFDSYGFVPDLEYIPNCSGQRRTLVEQYYKNIDFSSEQDVKKLLTIIENVLFELSSKFDADQYASEYAKKEYKKLLFLLNHDGYAVVENRIVTAFQKSVPRELENIAENMSSDELIKQISRINNSIDQDPSLALGTSKELLETTCKTILRTLGKEGEKEDLEILVKNVRKELKLLPEDIDKAAKGSESIIRILQGFSSVVKGLSELRNMYGTGHGKDSNHKGITSRHARLAVGAATTLALFLWETYEVRNK